VLGKLIHLISKKQTAKSNNAFRFRGEGLSDVERPYELQIRTPSPNRPDRGLATRTFLSRYLTDAFFAVGMIFASGAFTLQLSGYDPTVGSDPAVGSMVSQGVLGTIYLISFGYLWQSRLSVFLMLRAWPVFLLPILAILSAAWSPDPSLTLRRAIALFGSVLFGVSLASVYNYRSCLRMFIRVLVALMILSAFWALAFPQSGVHQLTDLVEPIHAGKWRGVFAHKNPLGAVAGITLALLLLYGRWAFRSLSLWLSALAVTLVCLVCSGSGAGYLLATVITAFGLLMALVVALPIQLRVYVLALTFLALCFLSFFWTDVEALGLAALGKDPDLSGRVEWWGYIYPLMEDHWLAGFGYFAGFLKLSTSIETIFGANFGSTHNGYLDILVSFGLLGTAVAAGCLLLLACYSVGLVLFGPRDLGHLKTFPICFLVFVLLHSSIESSLIAPNSIYPLGLALATAMIARIYAEYPPALLGSWLEPADSKPGMSGAQIPRTR
jgi:exopolysaccharide production protein ExoQ